MTDNVLKSYQSLVDKSFAEYLRNPTELNHAIAKEAVKLHKAVSIVSGKLNSHDDKTAAYIRSQLQDSDKTAAYIESLLKEDN